MSDVTVPILETSRVSKLTGLPMKECPFMNYPYSHPMNSNANKTDTSDSNAVRKVCGWLQIRMESVTLATTIMQELDPGRNSGSRQAKATKYFASQPCGINTYRLMKTDPCAS